MTILWEGSMPAWREALAGTETTQWGVPVVWSAGPDDPLRCDCNFGSRYDLACPYLADAEDGKCGACREKCGAS